MIYGCQCSDPFAHQPRAPFSVDIISHLSVEYQTIPDHTFPRKLCLAFGLGIQYSIGLQISYSFRVSKVTIGSNRRPFPKQNTIRDCWEHYSNGV